MVGEGIGPEAPKCDGWNVPFMPAMWAKLAASDEERLTGWQLLACILSVHSRAPYLYTRIGEVRVPDTICRFHDSLANFMSLFRKRS